MLARVDNADDKDTSLAGVHGDDTSLAGVPVPNTTIMANDNDDLDTESKHNSVDTNKADDNSSTASVHSIPVCSTTSEPPQHPPDEEELDYIELPELETQVPILH